MEHKHTDSVFIILGDFNRAKLNNELPKYRQHVTCPTRESNILDHCYTVFKGAYRSVPRAALGLSDHCLVHLLPTYRQKLKCAKPVVSTVKKWTNEAKERLQDCMELTDWCVFDDATSSLDEHTDTVTSYISFCEDICVPTRTRIKYNNDKPWFNAKLKQLRRSKEEAYRSGDRALYNQARNTLTKEIKAAKKNYSNKLSSMMSRNEPSIAWRCLQNITSYKRPSTQTMGDRQLADDLNRFYCRFEQPSNELPSNTTSHPPDYQPPIQPALKICEEDVLRLFKKQKVKKAPGPDGISPSCNLPIGPTGRWTMQ